MFSDMWLLNSTMATKFYTIPQGHRRAQLLPSQARRLRFQQRELMLPVQHCLFTTVQGKRDVWKLFFWAVGSKSDFLILVCCDMKASLLSRSQEVR